MYRDEEFEDFNSEGEGGIDLNQDQQEHLDAIKDRLARANYEAIVKHGVDPESTNNIDIIKHLIEETMLYFQDLEEYEKCAELKKALDHLELTLI